MKTQKHLRIVYGFLNILMLVSLTHCRAKTDLDTSVMDPLAGNSNLSNSEVTKSELSGDTASPEPSENETPESERIHLPEGETDNIVIFEPPPPGHEKQPLRLLLLKVDPKEGYAHFKIRINRDRLDTTNAFMTCWHAFKDHKEGPLQSLSFDCTGLDEYVVDQLEPGFHQFYVELEGSTRPAFRSPPLNFQIQDQVSAK